ncbi:MAG: AmmeMemoRadiSam system protein B [Candidatus Zixiibacteriota bacterium]
MSRRWQLAGFVLLTLLSAEYSDGSVRQPAVAGAFYPADSTALARVVGEHLHNVPDLPEIDGRIVALIVPHAGLVYSGQIAAYSYKLLENSGVTTVFLCGPSHRFGFEGLSVYGAGVEWQTPLGIVPCHDSLCRLLTSYDERIKAIRDAHVREHSLEVQLPYLQSVLSEFHIVPIVMGFPNSATIDLLAEALSAIDFDDHTVMVASTDWQHYRPATEGWTMDSLSLQCLRKLDADRLEQLLQGGKVEACGGGPAVAVMKAARAKGANRVKVLRYGDSGDVSGDKSSVVGYVAAVLYAGEEAPESTNDPPAPLLQQEALPPTFELTDEDKNTLLEIARSSIEQYLTDGPFPTFDVSENLQHPGAAFVTLEKNGQLRGCIGHTEANEALYKTVSICAVQSAVADRRFPPVQLEELDEIEIEISVLTPLQDVKLLNEIEVGRDGLMISMGNRLGLLLPQVATEYGWDRVQFLRQTCLKAGLPTDAYKSPHARIQKFQAVIFHEEKE